jgi:spermidine/putrescine-binding protein
MKNTPLFFLSLKTACILSLLAACSRDTAGPQPEAVTPVSPLSLEATVSVISDYQMLNFDFGSEGDKALREFTAATGCLVKINKLSFDITGLQQHDLVIAESANMRDLRERKLLADIDLKRVGSGATADTIDKRFISKANTYFPLQWSPVGVLRRVGVATDGAALDAKKLSLVRGPSDLENTRLDKVAISAEAWQLMLDNTPEIKTQWQFASADAGSALSPHVYQMAINKQLKNPHCTYALMEFLLIPKVQIELAKQWRTVPVVKSACYGNNALVCNENSELPISNAP